MRYGDEGSKKLMAKLIEAHGRKIPDGHILCSVSGCNSWINHKSKYCNKHREATKRHGHPLATPLKYPKHSDHIKYARAALSVIRKTPEGKEAINKAIEHIQKLLRDSYDHLPRNPYDHLNWTKQETTGTFYCNLAEHKVNPSKFLERITATLVAYSKGFHKFYSYKQLQYSLSRAVLSLAPRPLVWSNNKNEWVVRQRIPKDALESLGEWAMYHMAPIERRIEQNHQDIMKVMIKRKELGAKRKRNPKFTTLFKKYRYENGDIAWRGRRVRPDGTTYDPLSGGLVSAGMSPKKLLAEAEREAGPSRNKPKGKVITRETISGP